MKHSPKTALSALGRYLWEQRISDRQFADMMATHLSQSRFSPRTVEKWRYGHRTPSAVNMRAIKELTGVSADDMLEGAE